MSQLVYSEAELLAEDGETVRSGVRLDITSTARAQRSGEVVIRSGGNDLQRPGSIFHEAFVSMETEERASPKKLARRLAPAGMLVLEHVHPESGRLHDAFMHSAGLEVQERTVVHHAIRPFEVLTLQRPA